MRDLPLLDVLDISTVTINAYIGEDGTVFRSYREYPKNEIPQNALDNTGQPLRKIILPHNITSIGSDAFARGPKIESITIPNSVISIGSGAFDYCDSLKRVVCLSTTPPILGNFVSHMCFRGAYDGYSVPDLYVPVGTLNAYKNEPTWEYFVNKIHEAILTITTQSATSITNTSAILNGKLEFIYGHTR